MRYGNYMKGRTEAVSELLGTLDREDIEWTLAEFREVMRAMLEEDLAMLRKQEEI